MSQILGSLGGLASMFGGGGGGGLIPSSSSSASDSGYNFQYTPVAVVAGNQGDPKAFLDGAINLIARMNEPAEVSLSRGPSYLPGVLGGSLGGLGGGGGGIPPMFLLIGAGVLIWVLIRK